MCGVCVCFGMLKKCGKKPCVDSKTPLCVHSKRPRVCRQHAHILFNMCAWCRQSRGRFVWTHGKQGGVIVLTKICPRGVITWPQGSTKDTNGSYPFSVLIIGRERNTLQIPPIIPWHTHTLTHTYTFTYTYVYVYMYMYMYMKML